MILLKRRPAAISRTTESPVDSVLDAMPPRWRAVLAALAAAAISAGLICSPIVLTWLTSAYGPGSGGQAVELGLSAWLFSHGVPLDTTAGTTISMFPWLLTLVPLASLTWAGQWVLSALPDGRVRRLEWAGGLRHDVAVCGGLFVATYALAGLGFGLIGAGSGFAASVLGSISGPALIALVGFVLALRWEFRDDLPTVAPGLASWWRSVIPLWARRAVRPAAWGVVALLVAGLVLVVAASLLRAGRIIDLHGELGTGFLGGLILIGAQGLYLPSAAVWADSWLAGPGFSLGSGSSITWAGSDPGLMPLIPMLGAVPDPGPLPALTYAFVLVPIAAGILVGIRSMSELTKLASWQAKASTMAIAVGLAGLVMTLLGAMASGSLGGSRLAQIGVNPLLFGLCVTVEMLLGGAAVVATRHLRARAGS